MYLLPTTLAPLANVCAKDSVRFAATAGIKIDLEMTDEGPRFTAVATDGRRMIRVKGDCVSAFDQVDGVSVPQEYPVIDALASAPNGETSSIIPAKDWQSAMTQAQKMSKRNHRAIMRSLPIVCGKDVTTFAATDMDRTYFAQPRNVGGRFPATDQVIPNGKRTEYSIDVDPILLAETLETVSKLGSDSENIRVTLDFQKPDQPFTIRTHGKSMEVIGVMVPLSAGKKQAKMEEETPIADERTIAEHTAALENASRTIEELRKANVELEAMNALLRRNFDALRDRMKAAIKG